MKYSRHLISCCHMVAGTDMALIGGGGTAEKKKKKWVEEQQGEEKEEKDGSCEGRGRGSGSSISCSRDPLDILGSDVMMNVMERLDARSVARSVLVSHAWQTIASCDQLWNPMCVELWKGKAHISHSSMVRGVSKLEAYSMSTMDGKRSRITKEDLCDHAWEFHFKETAPPYWLNLDPSWTGTGPPMHRYFHSDGSQTADPADEVWGGHECNYSVVTSFQDFSHIKENYVRINRWPQMSISRKQDWSWEMRNNIYSYSSIPDAEKEGGTGPFFPFW